MRLLGELAGDEPDAPALRAAALCCAPAGGAHHHFNFTVTFPTYNRRFI